MQAQKKLNTKGAAITFSCSFRLAEGVVVSDGVAALQVIALNL